MNIYGEQVRQLTGHMITVSAKLYAMDDETVGSLSSQLSGQDVSVTYSAPDARTSVLEPKSFTVSLDSITGGKKLWNGEVTLHTPFAADCL